jgi:single-strand DNA-binding protein
MAKRTTTQEAPADAVQTAAPQRAVLDITGNVARAPELRYTPSGKAICNVRLGVNGDDGQTRWFTIAAWEHLAELVNAHVKKGDRLGVRGPVSERQWTGRDGAERTDRTVTAWVLHVHRRPRPDAGEEGA